MTSGMASLMLRPSRSGGDGRPVLTCPTEGKVHRESRAVRAAANGLTAAADDLGVARVPIVGYVAIVFMPVRLRHQHLDVLADHLVGGIAEQFFARRVEYQ